MTDALGRLGPLAWAVVAAPLSALAILAAYEIHPAVPVAVVAGLAATALVYLRPLTGVIIALALIPLEVISLPLGDLGVSPSESMFILTGLAWAARRLIEGHRPWTDAPLTKPLFLLWAAALPGLVFAQDPSSVLRWLIFWGAFNLLFHVVTSEAKPADVKTLLFTAALAGAVVAAVAIAGLSGTEQELHGGGDTATGRARVEGLGDPNILGALLAMSLPAAVLLALESRWRRPLALGATALTFAGLALSLSRGGMFGAAGALLVMLGWRPMRRVAVFGTMALIGLTLISANPLGDVNQVDIVVQRLGSLKNQAASKTDQRPLIYRKTPEIIADHWLIGVGALNYAEVAPRYGIIDPATSFSFNHAHDVPLTVGAELGIFGLIALGWLIVAAIRSSVRAVGRRAGRWRGTGFAVTGALAAIGVQSIVDVTLRSNIVAAFTFVLFGCLMVLARAAAESDEPTPRPSAPALPRRAPLRPRVRGGRGSRAPSSAAT